MPKEYFRTLNREKIKQMMEQQYDFVLLDVLPPEYYAEIHIKDAVNACVYDVDFLQLAGQVVPDKEKTVVVYCNSATSRAPDVAVTKLAEAGYTNVFIYRGGTVDWKRARYPLEGGNVSNPSAPHLENKVYTVDLDESVVQWIGRNISGAHYGIIKLQSGTIPVRLRQPGKVAFVIDMNTIRNLDVQDPGWNRILVDHLKSEDFFDVKQFPAAKFDATEFKPIEGAAGGGSLNYEVRGQLTIKGIANEIVFPALLVLNEDGSLAAEAHFDIDRTRWNVNYGSGRFFEKLGKHLVHDFITIQLKLVAR